MITYHLQNGLFNGCVPIPEKYIKEATEAKTGIEVVYEGRIMHIHNLKKYDDYRDFPHQYKKGFYKLYYYRWHEQKSDTSISETPSMESVRQVREDKRPSLCDLW